MGGDAPKSEKSGEPTLSMSSGATVMSIQGRMAHERQRTSGMNADERAWRKKWLRDQVLSPREPLYDVRGQNPMMMNSIRHAYRTPLDILFYKGLQPFIGDYPARVLRYYTGKALIGLMGTYMLFYYFKYNTRDWTHSSGWRTMKTRPAVYAGEENYPQTYTKHYKREYKDDGFHASVIGRNIKNDAELDDEAPSPALRPFSHYFLQDPKKVFPEQEEETK